MLPLCFLTVPVAVGMCLASCAGKQLHAAPPAVAALALAEAPHARVPLQRIKNVLRRGLRLHEVCQGYHAQHIIPCAATLRQVEAEGHEQAALQLGHLPAVDESPPRAVATRRHMRYFELRQGITGLGCFDGLGEDLRSGKAHSQTAVRVSMCNQPNLLEKLGLQDAQQRIKQLVRMTSLSGTCLANYLSTSLVPVYRVLLDILSTPDYGSWYWAYACVTSKN